MRGRTISQVMLGLLLVIVTAGISGGCTKVINVNLNSIQAAVVIEGNVYNQPGPYTVLINKTSNYFDTISPPPVTSALVTITDNNGPADTLQQVSPGTYQTTRTQGVQGHTYTLTVVTGSQKYQAISTMPDTVSIAYLSFVQPSGFRGSSSAEYRVHCHFKDPGVTYHYYHAVLTYNDTVRTQPDDLTVYSDQLSQGDSIDLTLRSEEVLPGDTATVNLYAIDQYVYNYLNVLSTVLDQNGVNSTTTPQNPPSNISNGALGYFSASAVTTKSAVAP